MATIDFHVYTPGISPFLWSPLSAFLYAET